MEALSKILELLPKDSLTLIPIVIALIAKLFLDWLKLKESSQRVQDAERKAFDVGSEEVEIRLSRLYDSHEGLKEKAGEIKKIIDESQGALVMGRLFNLYSKQIEMYQQQTRNRASWSFIFAIVAMFLGMGFVFWGGAFVLSEDGANHVVAGSAISAIGGGISAYITKTFLDVHKLSLTQLNRYFQQPVINDHILMAQRLTEEVDDKEFKKKNYEKIIDSVTALIDSNDTTD